MAYLSCGARMSGNWHSASCPCLTTLESFGVDTAAANVNGRQVNLGSEYGQPGCAYHDLFQHPTCIVNVTAGCSGSDAILPSWCFIAWCYVNASTCDISSTASTYRKI